MPRKRYKSDTSTFVKWLYETGTKCGYTPKPVDVKKEESNPAKASRLKGKARKEAKAAATKPASKLPKGGQRASCLVNPRDLMPLTQAIVGSNDASIKVPIDVLRAGLRAVSARKRCTAHFVKQTEPSGLETLESNQSHSHFTALMESVIMTLQPRFAVETGRKVEAEDSKLKNTTIEELENRFATLEVEEPAEVDSESTAGAGTSKPQAEQPSYELQAPEKKEDLEEEKVFAIYCLLDDLNQLRSYVQKVWIDYKAQRLDLITASVTTNTVIQLARRTQDEILTLYPASAEYEDVLNTLVAHYAKSTDQGPVGPNETGEVELDQNEAECIFAPAHSILENFCEVLKPGQVPVMKRWSLGIYNALADRSQMNDGEKNLEDLIVLMDILPEFCFIAKYKVEMFTEDELTRGLCQMALTKQIPVWLVFGVTIFLDIHHHLREYVRAGYHYLRGVAEYFNYTLDRYFELSDGLAKPGNWPKAAEKDLHLVRKAMDDHILGDVIFPLKENFYRSKRLPPPYEWERFYLYNRHPILCGMTAFSILLEAQKMGMAMINCMGTAIFPAHFYNALRQKMNPIAPWPMMEELIALHGEDRVFIGAKPETIIDCFKQICLTLESSISWSLWDIPLSSLNCLKQESDTEVLGIGYAPETFAINRRQIKAKASKKGPRGLKDNSPLFELFYDGLRSNEMEGAMNITMHKVEALLNEQAADKGLAGNASSKRLRREWAATKSLSTIDLLDALMASVPQQLQYLYFDYFKMHRQSVGLLRALHTGLDEDYKKFYGPTYLDNESQLPWLAPYALMAAVGTLKAAEAHGITQAGSKLLEKAGNILEEYIAEEEAFDKAQREAREAREAAETVTR
ncbi:uncharacterized protein PAC_07558 [Phialocephala subalpina]|uniref:DUF6604 domain-containing protein n=1 Tax=Phialocephala subalpina TaxID=576137 RepID=A0A1L7WY27_9HELO|nr:uncharacterized protein PAC_07558 [Phialocephala subalpina]